MSSRHSTADETDESYPEFGLSCRFDDPADPEEVTLFRGDNVGHSTTEWLTVGVDDAVPLTEAR